MRYSLDSLANVAKDRIGRKNPFPRLPGLPSGIYACKWGLTDLYPEDEKILRDAISARNTFDTGWCDCRKEIRSFRVISDGKNVTVQASAEMDDFDDLIYDALEDDNELTEEQIDELRDMWSEAYEIDTCVSSEETVPLTTYEDVMSILGRLEDQNNTTLDSWFEIVKSWVKEVTSR